MRSSGLRIKIGSGSLLALVEETQAAVTGWSSMPQAVTSDGWICVGRIAGIGRIGRIARIAASPHPRITASPHPRIAPPTAKATASGSRSRSRIA